MGRRTLLTAARRAGIRVGHPCRGEGVCGKCTLEIVQGAEGVEPPSPEERALHRRERLRQGERIACLCAPLPGHTIVVRVGGGTYRVET